MTHKFLDRLLVANQKFIQFIFELQLFLTLLILVGSL